VGGSLLLGHLVGGAAAGPTPTPLPAVDSSQNVEIVLTVVDGPRRVRCITTADRVSADTVEVTEFDLPSMYVQLDCRPPTRPEDREP